MLGRQNHQREARSSGSVGPLAGVEARRAEDGRALLPGAPFAVREGVHAEMEEHDHLSLLPL